MAVLTALQKVEKTADLMVARLESKMVASTAGYSVELSVRHWAGCWAALRAGRSAGSMAAQLVVPRVANLAGRLVGLWADLKADWTAAWWARCWVESMVARWVDSSGQMLVVPKVESSAAWRAEKSDLQWAGLRAACLVVCSGNWMADCSVGSTVASMAVLRGVQRAGHSVGYLAGCSVEY